MNDVIDDSSLVKTRELFAKCQEVISGGESSYARLIGTRPIVMDRGEGGHFFDVDGNEYIDWCIGYGPMIFGHRPKPIVDAIVRQVTEKGMLYTFPHELDYEVGRKIVQAVPASTSCASPTRGARRRRRRFASLAPTRARTRSSNGRAATTGSSTATRSATCRR